MGSLSAPRLRRYVEPLPLAYRLFRGMPIAPGRWTRAFQPGRGADEPLRWSVTPAAKREATLSQMRSQVRFAVLLRRRIPRPEITDGLQLASSWTRDERSLTLRRGRGIRCGQGLWSSLPSRGRETRPTEHCSVDWRGGWGDNASVAPHPATPAYRRARHPPLKGRDERTWMTGPSPTEAMAGKSGHASARVGGSSPAMTRVGWAKRSVLTIILVGNGKFDRATASLLERECRCPPYGAAGARNCASASLANTPPLATSSSKLPLSTMRPRSNTRMRVAFLTVASLWAMTNVVRPFITSLRAAVTLASVAAASALVASSRIRIGGSFRSARAIDSLCRSPPDSMRPRSPTFAF